MHAKTENKVEPSGSNGKTQLKCIICTENHLFQFCNKYKSKSVDQRKDFLDKNERCYNCLGLKHTAEKCYSKKRCMVCNGKHHTTIHNNNNRNNNNNNNNRNKNIKQQDSTNINSNIDKSNQTKESNKNAIATEQVSLAGSS